MIVVETKSPESGQLRLSYSGNYGISFADLSDYNLMDASEKLEYELLAGAIRPWQDMTVLLINFRRCRTITSG